MKSTASREFDFMRAVQCLGMIGAAVFLERLGLLWPSKGAKRMPESGFFRGETQANCVEVVAE